MMKVLRDHCGLGNFRKPEDFATLEEETERTERMT